MDSRTVVAAGIAWFVLADGASHADAAAAAASPVWYSFGAAGIAGAAAGVALAFGLSRILRSKTISDPGAGADLSFAPSAAILQGVKDAVDQHAIVVLTDTSGRITYTNDKFCEISGYSRAELIGKTHRIVNSGFHPKSFWAEFWKTISSGQVWNGEICNRAKNGSLYWVEATVMPLRDASGTVTNYIAVRTDITATKNLAMLNASILDSSLGGVMAFRAIRDAAGRIADFEFVMVNRIAESIVGERAVDLIGRKLTEAMPGTVAEGLFDRYVRVVETGQPLEMEHFYSHEKIERRWFQTVAVKLNDGFAVTFLDITERKTSEQIARESEARFRLFVEQAPTAIAMFDTEMRYIAASQQWTKDYGLAAGDIIGKSHYDVFPEIGDDWKAIHRQCLEGAVESRDEDLFVRADGTRQWLRWTVRPWRGSDGSIGGLLMFTADVTAQVQARQEIVRMRDRLEATLQAVPDLLFEVDNRGRIVEYRSPSPELLAVPPEDFINRSIHEVLPRDVAATIQHAINEAEAKGLSTGCQYSLHTPAGERWFELSVARRKTLPGDVPRFVAMARDINERKEFERSLVAARDAEARALRGLQAVINSATQVSIIATDPNGLITVFNTGAEQMLGYLASEVVGRHTPELIHLPEEVEVRGEVLSRELGRTIKGFDVFVERARQGFYDEREWTYVRKDGRHVIVSLVVTAIRDEYGEISGFLGIAVDITIRKQAELALKEARDHALEATRAKSAFLANMSHEIRTPLNGVIGVSGLLLDTRLDDEQLRLAETIRASGEHLLDLINDILDFSKVEAGKLQLENISFNLPRVIEDSVLTLMFKAKEKAIALSWDIEPGMATHVIGDPARLRQVLINLISNAIKFTDSGSVSISVMCDAATGPDAVVRFEVKDTGIGIPPDKFDRLFEAFTQADVSTTRRYGGSGLGLAICKQIVELMGGKIGVESEVGRGSTFWFTVRLALRPSLTPIAGDGETLAGTRILLVEPDSPRNAATREAIESSGFVCDVAASGGEALERLRAAHRSGEDFHAIVIDSTIGDMRSEELGRAIKRDPAFARIPLVMIAAVGLRGDASALADAGFSGYLTRPLVRTEFRACVAAVLRSAGDEPKPAALVTRHTIEEARRRHRILLVEDNAVNQTVALGMLSRLGYTADLAENGRMAIERLAAADYDLVLMDCQMPVMDGYDAAREIRSGASRVRDHDVPIVAMTANALAEDRNRCIEAGMNDYVAKPVRIDTLDQVLDRWLRQRDTSARV